MVLLPLLPGLVPASLLDSDLFQVLVTFVALNSLMYATLAILKIVPKGYALFRFNGRNRRRHNRSIYPDSAPPDAMEGTPASGVPTDLPQDLSLTHSGRPGREG